MNKGYDSLNNATVYDKHIDIFILLLGRYIAFLLASSFSSLLIIMYSITVEYHLKQYNANIRSKKACKLVDKTPFSYLRHYLP